MKEKPQKPQPRPWINWMVNMSLKSTWYTAMGIAMLPLLVALALALCGSIIGALSILPFAWPGSGL